MLSFTPLRSSTTKPSLPPHPNLTPHRSHHSLPPNLPLNPTNLHRPLRIRSIDAAQPYDHEARLSARFDESTKLKIAIIGFGNFGQFLAKTLVRQGHIVSAHSRSNHSDLAKTLGVTFFPDADDLCEDHPDVILLCTSIISTEKVLRSLPVQRLRRSTLFVDVLSVKEFPRSLFLQILPSEFDILCTHPMFGPESGKDGWTGLPFVYDRVRVGSDESRVSRCDRFVDIFAREGCRMVEMSCGEHDRHAAGSQFITHTVGRVLEKLRLESTPINTKGYETLLDLVENTAGDSFDLYYGLFMYNKNSMEQLERLDLAFESLKKQLFGHLHDVIRKQLFGNAEGLQVLPEKPALLPEISNCFQRSSKLKIAIVGFGNFGQFLAKTLVCQGHTVLAHSRSNCSDAAQQLRVSFFANADDLCKEHPDVVLLCTSIISAEKVLRSLPLHRLKKNTLFVDVLSVKEFPKNLFLQILPPDFDVLCTHPMFGPESGKHGWNGLPFLYDKVRVGSEESRQSRCDQFLDIFAKGGCRMVEMSCAEHDWHAAGSQFITHTVGRVLEKLELESTPINTKGYETLLNLVDNTARDSFDLYYGLFMYNKNAMKQLERLDMAFKSLKKELFGRLRDSLHKQLFGNAERLLVSQVA